MIAEKIINDLEVFCINDKYCKWKDKLEVLSRHVEVCEFQDKNLKDWLQGFDRFAEKPIESNSLAFYENEQLQERINNEVPKAPLLARLYTKDSSSKALFTLDNFATNKNQEKIIKSKDNVIDFLEGYLFDNNEEEQKEKKIDSKENDNDSVSPDKMQLQIISSDEDEDSKKLEEILRQKTNIIKNFNDEKQHLFNIMKIQEVKEDEIKEDLEKELFKKRKLIEPFLVKKLKQMKT